jgi:polyhydroxybutyrate depolymerase
MSEWARSIGCDALATIARPVTGVEIATYPRCVTGDEDALLYTIVDGGHTWPGSGIVLPEGAVGLTSQAVDATSLMWDFFVAHQPPATSDDPSISAD